MGSQDARRLPPIYDAIDSGAYKTAIQACNKILKKQPKSLIAKTLKSLALLRSAKVDEAIPLCDEVFEARPTDENVVMALAQVLRQLERHEDIITLYDSAFKANPNGEELGFQAFLAMIRIGNWKSAQQISHRMSRTFKNESRYLCWSVMCAVLQACDPDTEEKTKSVLLNLALHLFRQLPPAASHLSSPDKLHLLLEIYLSHTKPQLEEAYELLSSKAGRDAANSSLAVDEVRHLVWMKHGKFVEERDLSRERLSNGDRNWLTFQAYLDSSFAMISDEGGEPAVSMSDVLEFLSTLSVTNPGKDRGSTLILLDLEKRLRSLSASKHSAIGAIHGRKGLGELIETYFEQFGEKPACFEDLVPYVQDSLSEEERLRWVQFLQERSIDISSRAALDKTISAMRLLRYMGADASQSEDARGIAVFQMYLEATRAPWASSAGDDLNPADGLALLAANHFVQHWSNSGRDSREPLHRAILVLEFASSRSPNNYRLRTFLIRLYKALGAQSLAIGHYRKLNVRTLQHETLSHFVMERATTWSVANDGDFQMIQEALDSSQIYQENNVETPEMLMTAFLHEKYSQIQNFIEFEDRLDRSLQRDLIKIDHIRMRFVVEPPTAETLTLEIGELDYMYLAEKVHHDNRDYSVLPNLQPKGYSIDEQTRLGPRPGVKWCDLFVQIYIRVLNRAAEPNFHSPHLFRFSADDLNELTEAEKTFAKFAEIIAEWMWPSDKPRPTSEQDDTNTKYIPTSNGVTDATLTAATKLAANGEPLVNIVRLVVAAELKRGETKHMPLYLSSESERTSEGALSCLQSLVVQLKSALGGSTLPWEILHIASLIQEAFVIMNIQIAPFGPQTNNGKAKKADALWPSIKAFKVKVVSLLHDVGKLLIEYGAICESASAKDVFVKHCEPITGEDSELVSYVNEMSLGAAQAAIFSAMGRGIGKIADGKRPIIQGLHAS